MIELIKYTLVEDDTIIIDGIILYRIKSLQTFSDVKEGQLGGYIEHLDNLSHAGLCWIYNDACVYQQAKVRDNAKIFGHCKIYGNAIVSNNAKCLDYVEVFENSLLLQGARLWNYVKVSGHATIEDSLLKKHVWIKENAHITNSKIDGNITIQGNSNFVNADIKIDIDEKTTYNSEHIYLQQIKEKEEKERARRKAYEIEMKNRPLMIKIKESFWDIVGTIFDTFLSPVGLIFVASTFFFIYKHQIRNCVSLLENFIHSFL